MTDSMIERVAKAIFEYEYGKTIKFDREDDPEMYDSILGCARAAIKALREPTDEMGHAGSEASVSTQFDSLDAKSCWQAMIDAALNEEKVDG